MTMERWTPTKAEISTADRNLRAIGRRLCDKLTPDELNTLSDVAVLLRRLYEHVSATESKG